MKNNTYHCSSCLKAVRFAQNLALFELLKRPQSKNIKNKNACYLNSIAPLFNQQYAHYGGIKDTFSSFIFIGKHQNSRDSMNVENLCANYTATFMTTLLVLNPKVK